MSAQSQHPKRKLYATKPKKLPAPQPSYGPTCYLPTPEQIAEECAKIRAEWDLFTSSLRHVRKRTPNGLPSNR